MKNKVKKKYKNTTQNKLYYLLIQNKKKKAKMVDGTQVTNDNRDKLLIYKQILRLLWKIKHNYCNSPNQII